MTPHDVVAALGIYGGAFVVGAISSVIPFVSIDAFLVGLVLAAGAGSVAVAVPVVVLAAAGQLVGKLPLYAATRGARGQAQKLAQDSRHRARLERWRTRLARWQRAPHLVLALSALVGLPPFSVMATAAGALAVKLRPFCAVVFFGRAARFAAVIAITVLASARSP